MTDETETSRLVDACTRLTAERNEARDRAAELEAENAELHRRLESIRLVASTLPYAIGANPRTENAQAVVASLGRAIDAHAVGDRMPQDDSQRHAERPAAVEPWISHDGADEPSGELL